MKKTIVKKLFPKTDSFGDDKIEMLLSPKTGVDLKIENTLLELNQVFNLLFISNKTSFSPAITFLMKKFSKKKGSHVTYVAVNKPFEKVQKEFLDEKIDLNNVNFIDMVTMQVGAQKVPAKNVTYLSSAESLSEVLEEIERKISEKVAGEKFLLFDSVSTLFVYNDPLPVEKMIHSLMGKLSRFKVSGVFLMAKSEEHEDIIQTISQFCDKVIEI